MNEKTILVTGGSKRIGESISRLFAKNSWRVLVHYNKSQADAQKLVSEITACGGTAEFVGFDLNEPQNIDGIIKELCAKYPDLQAIINNASVFEYDDAISLNHEIFAEAMRVNCLSPILLTQAFAKYSNAALDRRIINILDQKLKNPNPDYFSYSVSKFALSGATEMLAMELGKQGIRINNIAPGLTMQSGDQTQEEFAKASTMNLLNKPVSSQAIANAAMMLVNTNIANGQTIFVDCGQHLIKQERDIMFLIRES
jgi:NAD(P)-dependent dehydrogenase (short-subunit alcohol dehydrogenase family)